MTRSKGAMSLLLIGFLVTFFTGCGPRGPIATPTPTKTSRPLVTPAPPPTNTPEPPTPTPTPESDRCPWTGEAMEEAEKALRRPLIVKIGNGQRARPQSGLHKADIVIEHLAEGGDNPLRWCLSLSGFREDRAGKERSPHRYPPRLYVRWYLRPCRGQPGGALDTQQ